MWVVYNLGTAQIIEKFYSKQKAKDFIKYDLNRNVWFKQKVGLEKVDIMRLDEWKMWKTLQLPTQ